MTTVGPTALPASPVFVLGAHRSGTTLLQRLLNSYPDVNVWGEHAGILQQLADAYFRAVDEPNMFRDVRPARSSDPQADWQAWMNGLSRDDWDALFRDFLGRLVRPHQDPSVRYWGFKEIRYGTSPNDRTLELLSRLAPSAHFVFLVRHPLNAFASAYRKPEGPRDVVSLARTCQRWLTRFDTFHRWHTSGALSQSYWIKYEDLSQGRGDVLRLLESLAGKTLGPDQQAVLDAEGGRGSSFRTASYDERWKALPPIWLAVATCAVEALASRFGYHFPRIPIAYRVIAGPLWQWARRRVTES